MSKIWKDQITFMITRNRVEGANKGRVMYQNCCQVFAPSNRAAS